MADRQSSGNVVRIESYRKTASDGQLDLFDEADEARLPARLPHRRLTTREVDHRRKMLRHLGTAFSAGRCASR